MGLVAVGGWRLAVGGWWSRGLSLTKKKIGGFVRTAMDQQV